MSQSGSGLLRLEYLPGLVKRLCGLGQLAWDPLQRAEELRALGRPGLCPGRGNKEPLCEDLGGAAVPEDTYKLFSVPKVGRMSPRPGGGQQLSL